MKIPTAEQFPKVVTATPGDAMAQRWEELPLLTGVDFKFSGNRVKEIHYHWDKPEWRIFSNKETGLKTKHGEGHFGNAWITAYMPGIVGGRPWYASTCEWLRYSVESKGTIIRTDRKKGDEDVWNAIRRKAKNAFDDWYPDPEGEPVGFWFSAIARHKRGGHKVQRERSNVIWLDSRTGEVIQGGFEPGPEPEPDGRFDQYIADLEDIVRRMKAEK